MPEMKVCTMEFMDLNTSYPRSPTETLAGLVHLPRMLDKARASLHDSLGEYIYPCPLDQMVLDFLGIGGDVLAARVRTETDVDIGRWAADLCRSRPAQDIDALNRSILERQPDSDEKWKKFLAARDTIDASRKDVTTWVGLIDLEEGRL